MTDVRDLDALRPERRLVKLHGHEIDVSFVPVGLTFDLIEISDKAAKLDTAKINKGDPAETRKAFDMTVELCATFCGHFHEEMSAEWFKANTNIEQINALGTAIRNALDRSYEGIDPKN